MPLGVPKVPYQLPSEEDAQWVDIYNRLYRTRVLFLCQDLNEQLANQLIGLLIYLNSESEEQYQEGYDGIFMHINSVGGSMTNGMGVFDAIQYVDSEVTTICMGVAASMASFVLAGGTYGRRIALPNARIMIHQPSGGSQGNTQLVLSDAEEMLRLRNDVSAVYAERTGQNLSQIKYDMTRDQYMSASEAKTYGLVDQVAAA